jgi:hypothetical protein
MAAPVTLYDRPPPYWMYVGGYGVAQTFALVGNTINYTTGGGYGGQPTGSVNTIEAWTGESGVVESWATASHASDPIFRYTGTGLVSDSISRPSDTAARSGSNAA